MALHVFCKAIVGLLFLHSKHIAHARVGRTEFQFPMDESPVHLRPVTPRTAFVNAHGQLLVLLLIAVLRHLGDFLPVDVLLQCQQYLTGVDRLNQIVGYLGADGLIHDILLLALGDHHHGRLRLDFLHTLQCLEPRKTRHHLVKHDEVKGSLAAFLNGVSAIGDGCHLISFLVEKNNVGLEQFYLIIGPKYISVAHS